MRLIVDCEHGSPLSWHLGTDGRPCKETEIADPDAILAALADAGVLEEQRMIEIPDESTEFVRYVSPWKETK